jgi:L,D-peptidoglycan transpeptidase YkuD (ErfK/YbiS/YcfS/YnhG family)
MEHFEKVANDFYWQSTPEERNNFVNFAFKLVKADHKISKEENIYIDALYNLWDLSVD